MKFEIMMLFITALCVVNVYYNGYIYKTIMQQKKYFQIAAIALLSFSVYLMIKKNPAQTKNILLHANDYIKYMPINKSTIDTLSPILDFTNDNAYYENIPTMTATAAAAAVKVTKRSVSETKKKYVASMQDWKCGECKEKLNAWYEIDHKKRLEYGGTNDVDNLVALCRECHGKKTAMENM